MNTKEWLICAAADLKYLQNKLESSRSRGCWEVTLP